MWDASESFIQTGTYWFTMRLRNVRNTSRAMIVPTVEATPSSSRRLSRIRIRMKAPGEYYGEHRAHARSREVSVVADRLDQLDRGLRDLCSHVGVRGAVLSVDVAASVVIGVYLLVGAEFAVRYFERHVLDEGEVDLR